MEDNRASGETLLVARSNEECWKICGGILLISENEK